MRTGLRRRVGAPRRNWSFYSISWFLCDKRPRIVCDDSVDPGLYQSTSNVSVVHRPGDHGDSTLVAAPHQVGADDAVVKSNRGGVGLVQPSADPVSQEQTQTPQSQRDERREYPALG